MANINKAAAHSALSRQLLAIAACSVMMLLAPAASAQVKNSAGSGPSASTQGGGASGSSNRGGAGGVSNPSPGGSPASLGGPAQSSGPEATEGTRSGYLGGRSVDPVTPPPEPPPVVPTLASVTQFGKCPTAAMPSPQARMSGNNMGRIDTVARHLGQGREPQAISTARYLLADMQEELEKPSPDLMLTASYMGIASAVPVTPDLVYQVGDSLCASVSQEVAKEIAVVAEQQRQRLLLGVPPGR